MTYPPGSLRNPARAAEDGPDTVLLGGHSIPTTTYTRGRDGSPIHPYDMATDTMFEFMGMRVDPVDGPIEGELGRALDMSPSCKGQSRARGSIRVRAFHGRTERQL